MRMWHESNSVEDLNVACDSNYKLFIYAFNLMEHIMKETIKVNFEETINLTLGKFHLA